MSLFEGLGEQIESAPLVDDQQNETVRDTTVGEEVSSNVKPFTGLGDRIEEHDTLPSVMREAVKQNPDQHAEVVKLANQAGVDPQIVAPSINDFKNEFAARGMNLEQMRKDNPTTAGFLSKYDNAAQFHDDIDSLKRMETAIKEPGVWEAQSGSLISGTMSIPAGIGASYYGIGKTLNRVKDDLNEILPAMGDAVAANPAALFYMKLGETLGLDTYEFFNDIAQEHAPQFEGTFSENPSWNRGVAAVTNAIPSIAAAVLASLAAGPQAGAFLLSASEAGPTFIEAEEAGEDTYKAATLTAGAGIMTFFLEKYGLEGIMSKGKGVAGDFVDKYLLSKAMKNTTLKKFTGDVIAGVNEGGTEFLQTLAQNAVAHYGYDDTRDLLEGWIESIIGGFFAGGGMSAGVRIGQDLVNSETKSQGEQNKLNELIDAAQNSKGLQRNSAAMTEFLQQATTEADNVHFPGAALNEYLEQAGIDPTQDPAFQMVADQIQEAAETGADVVMPLADFLTNMANRADLETLRPHLRLSADSFTPAEMETAVEEQQNYISNLLEQANENADLHQEAQQIFESVREQLIGSGRATPAVARLQAQIIPAWVAVKARETGQSVAEIYEQVKLDIQGPHADAKADNANRAAALGVVLDQDGVEYKDGNIVTESDNFRNWFGDSLVLDESGAPLVVYHGTDKDFDSFEDQGRGLHSFSSDKGLADAFGNRENGRVVPVYLSLKNPFDFRNKDHVDALVNALEESGQSADRAGVESGHWSDIEHPDILKSLGFDGVITQNSKDIVGNDALNYHVFDPTQIKSVFNKGAFDPNDPNILKQSGILEQKSPEELINEDSIETDSVADLSAEDGWTVEPVAADEAIQQATDLDRARIPEQTIVTIKEAQDWLEAHDLPRIAPKSQSSALIDKLRELEDFQALSIFDQIRLASQLERPIRKRDYNQNTTPKANKKLEGNQGSVRTGQNNKVKGSGVVATDTVRGCDHFCFECYALKGASQAAVSHQHPVLATLKGTIKDGELLRVGETGDPSRNWIHTHEQVQGVLDRSKQRGAKVTAKSSVFYTTKLLNLDGFNPATAANLQVTLDPLMPAHMWVTMENILRVKSAHPEVNVSVRIRSIASTHPDLIDATKAATDFANRFGLPVLETRMRFIRKSSLDLLGLDKARYKKVGNQFKLQGTALQEQSDEHLVCDKKDGEGCPSCGNCAKTAKRRRVTLDNQQQRLVDEGVDGIPLDQQPEIFDPVGGDVLFQDKEKTVRGYYDPAENMIRLTEASDLSTFLHESAHFFLEMERRMGSPKMEAINDWFSRNAAEIAEEANGYLKKGGVLEQSAFHGTPHDVHKDGGRFTTQKIGTGEGAQAYGWGLYFASNKEVAQYYRENLSGFGKYTLDGKEVDLIELPESVSVALSAINDPLIQRAAGSDSPKTIAKFLANESADDPVLYDAALWLQDNHHRVAVKKQGRLYHVELAPEADEYLLWDETINEQPDRVQYLLQAAISGLDEDFIADVEDSLNADFGDWKGHELYSTLVKWASESPLGDAVDTTGDLQRDASEYLHSLGIRGIKYLDGDSRSEGEGNHNFVIFSDEDVEITKYEQTEQTPTGADGIITEEMVRRFLSTGTSGDQTIDAAIYRATHEQFARGFEAYLKEGKAPSVELRDAFRAFAQWLTEIYRKIKGGLNVNLDDEMRAVFDRMLATEEQIVAAEATNRYQPLFTDAAMAGMTEEEFEEYQAKQDNPSHKARETLREKILKQLTRETEKWWKAEKAERVKILVEQLGKQKTYNAINKLREKNGELKLDRATVKQILGVEKLPHQLKGMTLTGMQGVSPDDAAALLGYGSGHEMVTDLMNARPIKEVANEQADAAMKSEHGDILNDGTLDQEAQDAAHNEERGKQILVELKALSRSQKRPTIDRAMIKQLAKENIGRLPMQKILPHKYRRAEIKAAQEAQAAMDAGDQAAALQAKIRQAMNFYLWREATDAHNQVDKILRFTRKYNKKSIREQILKAANGYMDQIDGLLERFQFNGSVKQAKADRQAITEWAAERAEDGDNIQLTKEALSENLKMHYKEVPYNTLLGLYDSIRNIDHVARFANKVKKDGELLDFLEIKREVLLHLDNLDDKYSTSVTDSTHKTIGQKVQWGLAQMTKLPVLFTWLDGGKRVGLMHKLLSQPFTDAAKERLRLYNKVGVVVADMIKNRSKEDVKRHNTKIHIPAAVTRSSDSLGNRHTINDGNFFGHQILSVALNMGNRSNLEKMLKGEGWVPADVADEDITTDNNVLQAILRHMTASDWDLVEAIWKQIDLLFPEMAAVHKRTSGLDLAKVDAAEFTVKLPDMDGIYRDRVIKGGYYPMKYDPNRSHRAEENEAKEKAMIDSIFGAGGMLQPSANTGAKIERTSYFAPVRFSLDVVPNHIDEVIQYVTHYEAVKQVYKITQDAEIRAAIKRKVGNEEYRQIRQWINDVAKDGKEAPVKQLMDPLLRKLRFGSTIGMMGFKASTGLMQISGLSNTVGEIGSKYTLRGLRHVVSTLNNKQQMKEMWKFCTESSKIMGDRIHTMDRELMNAMNSLRGKTGILAAAQETSMKHIAYIQTYMVDLPTWYGAYHKGIDEAKAELDMEDFGTLEEYNATLHDRAVMRADWTVENVQGSGMTKDMANIMRGQSEMYRSLTMFFSFFSSMWNMQRDSLRGAKSGQYSVTDLAAKFLFIYAIPVAYEMGLRGELKDDDEYDGDTWYEKFLTRLALYPTQTVPVVRDIANAYGTGFEFNMSPIQSLMNKGISGSKKTAEAVLTDDADVSRSAAKNTVKLGGALLGVPGIYQAWGTAEHLYNVIEEGDELTMRELAFGPNYED